MFELDLVIYTKRMLDIFEDEFRFTGLDYVIVLILTEIGLSVSIEMYQRIKIYHVIHNTKYCSNY